MTACRTAAPVAEPQTPQNVEPFRRVEWKDLSWSDDSDPSTLRDAAAQSLAWARKQAPSRQFVIADARYTAADLTRVLEVLESGLIADPRRESLVALLQSQFDLIEMRDPATTRVMATGYYVPSVQGSLEPDAVNHVPVYPTPSNLIVAPLGDFIEELRGKTIRGRLEGNKLLPYWDRAAILDEDVLASFATPIAWVKSEIDLLLIEIQGSGILQLPNGTQKMLGYAEKNGQPYRAVGRLLLQEGRIPRERMSMMTIRDYVRTHPEEERRITRYNPSFVFFRLSDDLNALGNLGFPLTPGRSIATDQTMMPPGLPALVSIERPFVEEDGRVTGRGAIQRMVFNQDTGGAIKGPGRLDFFWGSGAEAEQMASAMQHPGTCLVLVPRPQPAGSSAVPSKM